MEDSDEMILDKTNCENSVIVDMSDGQDPKQVEVDNLIQDNLENKKDHSMKIKGSRINDTVFNSVTFRPQRSFWVLLFETVRSDGEPYVYEPESRNPLIIRVFSLLLAALFFTATFTAGSYIIDIFIDRKINSIIAIVCIIVVIIIHYMFACYACCRKGVISYILFIIAVLAMTGLCAVITSGYKTTAILGATISVLLLTIICLLLACTSFDFTKYILIVFGILTAIFAASLILTLVKYVGGINLSPLQIGLTIGSCIFGAVMLIIEFQMVLGGKTVELCEDEHVYGAFLLYDSIVTLFLDLLRIIGYFMYD